MVKIHETEIIVSPIFEYVYLSSGDGIIGFTVFASDAKFVNHVEYFEPSNYDEVKSKMQQLREDYIKNEKQKLHH